MFTVVLGVLQTRSNARGFYAFLGLAAGTYRVWAHVQGEYVADKCTSKPITIQADEVSEHTLFVFPLRPRILYTCTQVRCLCHTQRAITQPSQATQGR